jgi:hypothetical protein
MLDCLKQIKKLPIATNKIIQYESSIPRKRGTLWGVPKTPQEMLKPKQQNHSVQ